MRIISPLEIRKNNDIGKVLIGLLTLILLSASLITGIAKDNVSAAGNDPSNSADISINVSDSPDPFEAWNPPFTYTVIVTNNSKITTARGAVVTDSLDSSTFFNNASLPCTVNETTNSLIFSLGDIKPGENVTFTVTVGLGHDSFYENDTSSNPEPGSYKCPDTFDIVNKVMVSASTPDPDDSNNTYYQPTNVQQGSNLSSFSLQEPPPEYVTPTPELPAAALLGLGLVGIGAFIVIRKRRIVPQG